MKIREEKYHKRFLCISCMYVKTKGLAQRTGVREKDDKANLGMLSKSPIKRFWKLSLILLLNGEKFIQKAIKRSIFPVI